MQQNKQTADDMPVEEKENEIREAACTPESEAPTGELPPQQEEPAEPTPDEQIAALRAELKEKDDRFLRMAAEYDNFRRRSKEEKDSIYDNALTDVVAGLLPVVDNLERAAAFDDGEQIKSGLALTAKAAQQALEKLGVSAVGAEGEIFDPKLHHAVMHIEDAQRAEGEIVEVFQKGYRKGNRIIRFAMVKTAN